MRGAIPSSRDDCAILSQSFDFATALPPTTLMDLTLLLFTLGIVIISVIAHEVSHGYAADALGDPTPRLAGRLTINPAPHFDPIGSFVIPLITLLMGGFIFGWAKPVPYNSHNFRNERFGSALVALAGPAANIALALMVGILIRFAPELGLGGSFIDIASQVVFLNVVLAVFNLIPVPPLDGSKILFALMPYRFYNLQVMLERSWIISLMIAALFLWQFMLPLVSSLFILFTGLSPAGM